VEIHVKQVHVRDTVQDLLMPLVVELNLHPEVIEVSTTECVSQWVGKYLNQGESNHVQEKRQEATKEIIYIQKV
jgi:hypothetical protein